MFVMLFGVRFVMLILVLSWLALAALPAVAQSDADRVALAVDAMTRLENVDLDANPALREKLAVPLAMSRCSTRRAARRAL